MLCFERFLVYSLGTCYLRNGVEEQLRNASNFKGLKKENLRDNMTNLELALKIREAEIQQVRRHISIKKGATPCSNLC
jgi:hypothetical protein